MNPCNLGEYYHKSFETRVVESMVITMEKQIKLTPANCSLHKT